MNLSEQNTESNDETSGAPPFQSPKPTFRSQIRFEPQSKQQYISGWKFSKLTESLPPSHTQTHMLTFCQYESRTKKG